ncbi:MAG: VCBS repeat-containing protein [Candidatus Gribaldobacteria bacterium]|nr:VCBS repeat-containing protein [Candidatus Gribaldobacteria bacterium]
MVLVGVSIYRNLNQPESSSVLPVVAPIVVKQPVVNNQPSTNANCSKEGGGVAGVGDNSICCDKSMVLVGSSKYNYPDQSGKCIAYNGTADSPMSCTYCGNGVCGTGENKCNCPKDCVLNLTLDVLSNAEYYSSSMLPGQRIKLVNGTYQPKPPIEGTIKLETTSITYGDLNNDGQEDVVVILATSGGGTGVFRDIEAVLNQNGKPFNVAMQGLADRTTINSITIQSGVITVVMSPKGDPRKVVKYKLSGDKLQEVN